MLDLCRTCNKRINSINTENLFEQDDDIMLHQIEALTGLRLLNCPNLPTNICGPCEISLSVAISCRERIIKAQQQLQELGQNATPVPAAAPGDPEKFVIDIDPELMDHHMPNNIVDELIDEDSNDSNRLEQKHEAGNIELHSFDDEEETFMKLINDDDDSNMGFPTVHKNNDDENENAEREGEEEEEENTAQSGSDKGETEQDNEKVRKRKRKNWKGEYICDQCGKCINNLSNLNIHVLRHTGVKKFACPTCGMKFYTASLLRRHEKLHTFGRPYTCHYCPNTFSNTVGRLVHERNHHLNYKPFKCTECDKAFPIEITLRNHMVTHTRIRKYPCDTCNMSFMNKSHLRVHLRTKTHKKRASILEDNATK